MHGVHELSPFFTFAALSALRTSLYPKVFSDTFFPSPLSEVCIPVHGAYTMLETHLQVS